MFNERLSHLQQARRAIDAEIAMIERAISKAAYDFSMKRQLVGLNELRIAEGKPTLTESQFASGCYVDDE